MLSTIPRIDYRANSLQPAAETEAEKNEKISGVFWECVGRTPSPLGGHICQFKFTERSPYHENIADRIRRTTFPAIEITATGAEIYFNHTQDYLDEMYRICSYIVEQVLSRAYTDFCYMLDEENYQVLASHDPSRQLLLYFFRDLRDWDNYCNRDRDRKDILTAVQEDLKKSKDCGKYLEELGYRFYTSESGEAMIELPDLEALSTRWIELQNKHPEMKLPNLKISSSEGIASDIEFAEGHYVNDALLSTGKEFCHDHFAHVRTRILLMLKNGAAYTKIKEQNSFLIQYIHRAIDIAVKSDNPDIRDNIQKNKDLLYFLLGYLTDNQYNFEITPVQEAFNLPSIAWQIENIWTNPQWLPYLEKRFSVRSLNAMPSVWKQVCEEVSKVNRTELREKTIVTEDDATDYLKAYAATYAWDKVMCKETPFDDAPFTEGLKKADEMLKRT